MYLKQIKINGFKSFADKTIFDFDKGITGIVGPNGSGKSNIVDAVRWVLGEQSIKSLRGDSTMTDVIFSGSKSRNPSASASVTLIFDNNDHSLKIDYTEVSVKRMIYKSGENEYYLNNEKVRLKDILELLMDSGSGKESFSIISQGDIANILSSKPEDRRIIFESAAGVLKYKKRKEEAIRKLDRTHDNIDRINDIINEIENQLDPLKKQSLDAKLYLDTKKELENVEISLIANDIVNINTNYVDYNNKIEILKKEIIELSTSNSTNDAELSSKKIKLNNLTNELYKKQDELLNATKLVEKINGEKNIISERKKYEVEDIKLHNNILMLKEDQAKYNNSLELLLKEIAELKNNIESNNNETEKYNIEINNYRNNYDKLQIDFNEKNKLKTNNEYKINMLENSIENNNNFSYAVKSVLNNPKLTGICDAIGNVINTEDKYKDAIDTALSFSYSFIITETSNDAEKAIGYLKSNSLGRVTFFPLNVIEARNVETNIYNLISNNEGFIDIASNLVTYDIKYKNIILNQLGNILIVDNMKNAINISKKINHRYRIITLDGEIIHVGGSLTGGTAKKNSSVILDKMELDKLKENNIKIEKDLVLLKNNLSTIESAANNINIKLDSLKRKSIYYDEILHIKNSELSNLKNKLDETSVNINSTDNILKNNISDEEENVINRYYESVKNKDNITNEINKLNNEISEINNEINIYEHNIKESGTNYYKKQNELKELEIKVGKMDVKLDTLLNTLNEDYNITFEKAKNEYILTMEENIARRKVNELKRTINDIGIVNIGAIEEYDRIFTRYEFLNNQKNDLYKAENTLNEIIREMDIIMSNEFKETFKQIQIEFKNVFKELFGGGEAYLKLTDPSDVLATGIDIIALPPGKKLTSISLLSGGEKALTALSLLFAILRVKPVPFCILDEAEAPLDESNVSIFGDFIKKLENFTQFIIITHKKKTMEYADVLYGITMQESGVSKLVSVRLEELK